MEMNSNTNIALSRFAEKTGSDPLFYKQVRGLSKSKDKLLKNIGESILLKQENPNLEYEEYYPIHEFKGLHGSITIIGLSTDNDDHIFKLVNDNDNITEIIFYYL